MHTRPLLALAILPLALLAGLAPTRTLPAPPTSLAPTWTPELTYASRTGADGKPFELKLNLAQPADLKPGEHRPCIIAIHGGGWTGGKRQDLDILAKLIAEQGWPCATISYRFAPTPNSPDPKTARFPAQLTDCAEAVQFLRANADKFGLDPNRIGAVGFSAGAHLAMMLAVADAPANPPAAAPAGTPRPGRVGAAVSFMGPTDLNAKDIPAVSKGIVSNLIGPDPILDGKPADARAKEASPLSFVTPDDAPILMFFGTKDPLVPHTQAYPMLDAMTAAGVPGRAEIVSGAGHGFAEPEMKRALAAMKDFFTEHLKPH